ncbi:MAG: hypothetical protein NC483_00050 [Ruminococcus sp.]|nr:hypothetical protein [Ruminococcus sp.]
MKNLKYFVFMIMACFILLSDVKADAVCAYKYGDWRITCTASNNSVSCTNQSVGNIPADFSRMSLTYSAFKTSDNTYKCPSSLYIQISGSEGKITDVSSVSKTDYRTLSNDASSSKIDNGDINNNSYENDPEYIAAKEDEEKYCNNNPELQDDAKCQDARLRMKTVKDKYVYGSTSSSDGKFDTEHPCSDRVLGVFTTIGWVFFIAKILIPIILIVFGCIDFGKAILSSKDDEIKKSAKTLVIRAIAGIIIFFIPTLLNFVINIIGSNANDVYNNQFSNCTKCMFKPNQSGCTSLGGH